MDNLEKLLADLDQRRLKLLTVFNIEDLKQELNFLRQQMISSDFWQNQEQAINISQRAEKLQRDYQRLIDLERSIEENKQLIEIARQEQDFSLLTELSNKIEKLAIDLEDLENLSFYTGPYDNNNALLSVNAGTGGVDAQDWAQMLERMYLRFAERKGWQAEILDRILANEAGIKSVMLKITGKMVYGNLRSENGVHRLLRNSPFNADGLRQTSFASVEVIPEIPNNNIVIKDEDIRLDVFRSSGPGGQSVNTTDSAVRLVHLPTGITVTCQTERSQYQNKVNAFAILRARLAKLELEKKEAEEKRLKGGIIKAEWGQQIRSYWFYGNRLVKDHRTNFEDTDVEAVMDGHLDEFILAYLRWSKNNI